MKAVWRIWVALLTVGAGLMAGFGASPKLDGVWWPIAGFWLTAGLAAYGLSVWTAICLTALGVYMDLMTDGPIGAWPLAFLAAYMVAAIAWERHPPIGYRMVESFALYGGMIVASLMLAMADGLAGFGGFSRASLLGDMFVTALGFYLVGLFILPREVREVRR